MATASIDVYVAAFVARCEVMRRAGQREVDEPGVRGLLSLADDLRTRLLVLDDRAYDVLAVLLRDARAGMISVSAAAARCAELVDGHAAWTRSQTVTAMICRELQIVPELTLPGELTLRPVRRVADDPPEGVLLEEAIAAAMRADPRIDDPPEVFADFLRSLPSAIRLFAAVDGDGVVRATSGFGTFGTDGNVFFLNTDPDWRGRGIAQAMCAAALRAVQECGARHASLDATDAAVSIYLRLGFEAVTRTTRSVPAG